MNKLEFRIEEASLANEDKSRKMLKLEQLMQAMNDNYLTLQKQNEQIRQDAQDFYKEIKNKEKFIYGSSSPKKV